jgi:cation transport ATPase
MKTTIIKLEGIESILAPAGIEKQMCRHPGIHTVETNFMTGTATVYHDESVTLADLKRCVAECGYGCSGECLPEHVCKPGDPPEAAAMSHTGHEMGVRAGHAMPAVQPAAAPATQADAHAGHAMPAGAQAGEMEAMAHEMGHGAGIGMEAMVRDIRNRFLVSFILAIPIFLYSPLFTDYFKIRLPLPLGLSSQVLSFLLTTPAVLYGGMGILHRRLARPEEPRSEYGRAGLAFGAGRLLVQCGGHLSVPGRSILRSGGAAAHLRPLRPLDGNARPRRSRPTWASLSARAPTWLWKRPTWC